VVGIKKIVRAGQQSARESFPVRSYSYDEFHSGQSPRGKLREDEKRLLMLEKEVITLRKNLDERSKRAEVACREAYTKGKAEGLRLGEERGRIEAGKTYNSQLKDVREKVDGIFKTLADSHRNLFLNAGNLLLEFALQLAQKILRTEPSVHKEVALRSVKEALSYIADRERIIIRVHPDDFTCVDSERDSWMPPGERFEHIAVETDESIDRGGCIVDSNSGQADARLGIQFSELHELCEKVWQRIRASRTESSLPAESDEDAAAESSSGSDTETEAEGEN